MSVPSDFLLHDRRSPATAAWEPIYACHRPDRVLLGIEVGLAHSNSRGLLHGGVIATLSDNAMGLSLATVLIASGRVLKTGLITASLSVDLLGKAEIGQWLVIDTVFTHVGGSQGVTQAFVRADETIVARANASFRYG